MIKRLVLLIGLLASPAAADPVTEMVSACFTRTGSLGQAASLLSTQGWQVGGNAPRGIEARAMTLPYMSGRSLADIRSGGIDLYMEALPLAAEEGAMSGFLTSPDGQGTLMMTHTGGGLDCTFAMGADAFYSQVTDLVPEPAKAENDPLMSWTNFAPLNQPTGVSGARGAVWQADSGKYTRANPVRPRDVVVIVTTTARFP